MKTYAIFENSFFRYKPKWMPEKLYRVVCHRSNPRSREYMLNLLSEKFPNATLINIDQIFSSGQIVLLYPDSIGLGWEKIEKKLMGKVETITVLNGRKRLFNLTSSVHKKLLFRRFLEVTFLPEIFFTPFLLLYGIFAAFKDKISGYKL